MTVSGPDFIALHVRDLERSARFYEDHLGLTRSPAGPPHAVVFSTTPAIAVREPAPGVDLDAAPYPGLGVSVWLGTDDAAGLYQKLLAADVPFAGEPIKGPFGYTFTLIDPDGHRITLHDNS